MASPKKLYEKTTCFNKALSQEQRQRLTNLCKNLEKFKTEMLYRNQREMIYTELCDLWDIIKNLAIHANIEFDSGGFEANPAVMYDWFFPKIKKAKEKKSPFKKTPKEHIEKIFNSFKYLSWKSQVFDKIITTIRLLKNENYYEIVVGKGICSRGQSVKLLEKVVADVERNGVPCTERAWKSFRKFFKRLGYGQILDHFNHNNKKLTTTIPVGKLFMKKI